MITTVVKAKLQYQVDKRDRQNRNIRHTVLLVNLGQYRRRQMVVSQHKESS